jgi:hypothetical protein
MRSRPIFTLPDSVKAGDFGACVNALLKRVRWLELARTL